MSFTAFRRAFRALADPEKAKIYVRFFKTGPGEYGEGDRFLGIVVPAVRRMVRESDDLTFSEIATLLASAYHEERLLALLILVRRFERGDAVTRKAIYRMYLQSTGSINNWDLVDQSAPKIVGAFLRDDASRVDVLRRLATSRVLWERRIAVLATFDWIYRGDAADALHVIDLVLNDSHDLMHKACGWMLREIGKRCGEDLLRSYLSEHASRMPRTALRYAIERFSPTERRRWLRVPRATT